MAQAVQVPPFGPVNPTLQVQLTNALHPLHEAPELTGHAVQVVATVAPTVVKYVPDPQLVHATLPVAVLYFPAAHAVQTPPSGPVKPTLQVQLVDALHPTHEAPELAGQARHAAAAVAASVEEYVPAPQSVHTRLPFVVLYFPAAHAEHGPPNGPVYPMLHAQEIDVLQPVHVAPELAGQARHAVAANVEEYVPGPQLRQFALLVEPVVIE